MIIFLTRVNTGHCVYLLYVYCWGRRDLITWYMWLNFHQYQRLTVIKSRRPQQYTYNKYTQWPVFTLVKNIIIFCDNPELLMHIDILIN
jgi:hypothetical protein